MRKLIILLICGFLAACTPGPAVQPQISSGVSVANPLSSAALRAELAKLPGALVSATDPLTVSFAAGTLFAEGAVLPMPGGTGLLDALAALVKDSNLSWQLKLRAAPGKGVAYAQSFASQRALVLRTYLRNFGIDLRNLQFVALAEDGVPLEMQVISSGSNPAKGVKP
jgi:hypothetical protein